ncbi:MAG: valine--pyruvate transaminase [Spirochaetales bacterium]|uniref:valine--pyruvate transaminase n=1 Tax=Bullifex sp. TaxID=2815808 RepID=UPI002A50BE7E|nr:valine--pyruvate transaminase [Bullifex sp.]MDD5972664.1 valine--pyruvate transaminase [Spirochaetales bacterium]MDD7271186.1 valine--pyruvate transaminase [Spirochaetales bacterium]MDY4066557.1 valine--pyruvate transaminase [Bullifex sp.]
MDFSDFGKKLTSRSGILLLMDDLGKPLPPGVKPYPLGGGNPARIKEVEKVYREEMEKILSTEDAFEDILCHYDAPQGRMSFVNAIASYFSSKYGWNVKSENVAISNGSQSAMFYIFNLFSGTYGDKKKTILFPLMPEYVGYADQGLEWNTFVSVPSKCEYFEDRSFKYTLDQEAVSKYLSEHSEVGAICVTRPTNPSGNVLTDKEIKFLSDKAKEYNIPLIIDNAYGLPFPNIVFTDDATPVWNENIILSMSLSKIGLPSLRTGIILASPTVIEALGNINAIAALASGSMGQALAEDLVKTGKLVEMADNYVKPFYQKKRENIISYINEFFEGTNYHYHRIEGSIFCFLYLPSLKISSIEFYKKLKERGVITVPGEYFFFGSKEQMEGKAYPHPHYDKCLRINYSAPDDIVKEGIRIIAELYKKWS